jgi:hypothetical protein
MNVIPETWVLYLISTFLLLWLGWYLCWWTNSHRWYHPFRNRRSCAILFSSFGFNVPITFKLFDLQIFRFLTNLMKVFLERWFCALKLSPYFDNNYKTMESWVITKIKSFVTATMYLHLFRNIQLLCNMQGTWHSPNTFPTMVHYSFCIIIWQLILSVQILSTTW